jgi:flagellum-specific peptidoglycan hydrolase FlgJ
LAGTPYSASDAIFRSFVIPTAAGPIASLRSLRAGYGPMAIPLRPSLVRSIFNFALMLLCLTAAVASVQRHQGIVAAARTAVDGLIFEEVFTAESPDVGDLPAMHPVLADVVDPRSPSPSPPALTAANGAIEPFLYDPQPGETLLDIARRFGVTLASLLWNNDITSEDEVPAGQKLTVLPVRGVVHRVQAGETAATIAERYGIPIEVLATANGLPSSTALWPGQTLVVRGGSVPLQAAAGQANAAVVSGDQADPTPLASAVQDVAGAVAAAMARPPEDLPAPKAGTAAQRQFILEIAAGARESDRVTGVPASVTLAQAILESDWGRSKLAREAKNLFGIKAHGRAGNAGVYDIQTWEVISGADVMVAATFKAYKGWADSIVDHGKWFHQQPRYSRALEVRDDPRAFARAINDAGYATDPAYSAKLITLMDRYDLYQYDVQP